MKRFIFSPYFAVLLYLAAGIPSGIAFMRTWTKPPQPAPASMIESIAPHPSDRSRLLVSTESEVMISKEGSPHDWSRLWHIYKSGAEKSRIETAPSLPEKVFLLAGGTLYEGDLENAGWRLSFHAPGEDERLLSFAVSPSDSRLFLGSTHALYESSDEGKTWSPSFHFPARGPVRKLVYAGNVLLILTDRTLYKFGGNFAVPVFSISNGLIEEEQEEPESAAAAGLYDAASDPSRPERAWLASARGVFATENGGENWTKLTASGLKSGAVFHLAYAPKSQRLIAGTVDGIYEYDPRKALWNELYKGLAERTPKSLAILEEDGKEFLYAAVGEGLAAYPLEASIETVKDFDPEEPREESVKLFHELVRLEPSAREVQLQVIKYANAELTKTRRWHKESRLKSLFPSFSFGKDFSRANSIDLDRGSTSDPDAYIVGPDDVDRGWDMDMSWDFSDLIWSSDQTSIDSREKLMVELRNELLAEATRIYYERRRLQMQVLLSPADAAHSHFEMLTRLDELTSLLDGMSGGFFGGRVAELYEQRPDLGTLWSFEAIEGSFLR